MQVQESTAARDQLARGIAKTRSRLLEEFGDRLAPDVITRHVEENVSALKDSAIAEFVPLFVYRAAREQLIGLTRNNSA